MKFRTVAFACVIASTLAPALARADRADELAAEVQAYSGTELVFRAADLPRGSYHDIMIELPADRRAAAAAIALAEVKKYPRGYLGAIGLDAIGIFDGLASKRGDGYRPYIKKLGGYRYYGLWNGDDALVAAYYSDGQLPLTLHHEIFHHVDGTRAGVTDYTTRFAADDDRFAAAVDGSKRYPALRIAAADRKALARKAEGYRLTGAVSGYAAKSAGEDQAETARHMMTALPDALLQMAREPKLAGSQRMLHVLAQYRAAAPTRADADWFPDGLIDVALGRAGERDRAALVAAAGQLEKQLRARIEPTRGDRAFTVWGREDARGVNWTLRRDLWNVGRRAGELARRADDVAGGPTAATPPAMRTLRLLARYRGYIADRWSLSPGTARYFDYARLQLAAAMAAPARTHATSAAWSELAASIDARGRWAPRLPTNRYASKVDAAIDDPAMRRAIRLVQPAAVRLDNGSGVNLTAGGVVLTAAHCAPTVGAKKSVLFPDGRRFTAVTIASDSVLDVALLRIQSPPKDLPTAPLAAAAPKTGTVVATIGQPGRYTPGGEPTGYQPFHVSVGRIRGFRGKPLGPQALGGTKHDAWTYWGHSGAPIFDARGRIVAMHNSWDPKTAMRHAVTWQALDAVLKRAKVPVARR